MSEDKAIQGERPDNEQNEKKQEVNSCTMEIKKLSDSITSLMDKEIFQEEDLDKAFEIADDIQEKYEEIIALLFDIRDKLPVSNEPSTE